MPQPILSKLDRFRELLSYDPETGNLHWRVAKGNRTSVGGVSGRPDAMHGYVFIRIDGVLYRAHRVAWVLKTGEEPPIEIDHINRNKADNRWANLRAATLRENRCNCAPRRNGKSGVKGVRQLRSGRWNARMKSAHGEVGLGTYDTLEDARAAFERAIKQDRGEFAYTV